MKYKKLGRTGLKVSEICLGTMTWGQQNSESEAHAQIDYALAQGINFMDTAEMYAVPPRQETQGLTERHIGSWFKSTGQRDKWILATKISGPGVAWVREGTPIGPQTIRRALEDSLKRLQTDYIDLYQLHWPNRGTYHFDRSWDFDPSGQDTGAIAGNMLATLETLDALIREGKIRHIGVSNESAWGIARFLRLAEENGLPRIASVQNEYSLLRRHFDLDLAELSHHEQVGLLAYSPLAGGVLSGKYLEGARPEGTRGAISSDMWRINPLSEPAVRAYADLARRHDLDPCQMAIAFCLTRPFMTSVIIGATSLEQLASDIGARDTVLGADVLQGIETLFRAYPCTL